MPTFDPSIRTVTATRPRSAIETLLGDFRGGLTCVAIAVAIILPLGSIAFAALGPGGLAIGVQAALTAAIIGTAVMTLVGGAAVPSCTPPTSTTLIFAGLVATLANEARQQTGGSPDLPDLLLQTSVCVGIAGGVQIALALLRAGSLVKYIPRPVVAGFMNGVAVLIVVSQIRPLLGLPPDSALSDVQHIEGGFKGASLALGATTIFLALVASRRWPASPWALLGLLAGTIVSVVAPYALPGVDFGLLLGAPGHHWHHVDAALALAQGEGGGILGDHLRLLVTTGIVLGVIGAMDALLGATAADAACGTRHDSNRLILGQGLANLASAGLGGIPISYSSALAIRSFRSDGRPQATAWITTAGLVLILLLGGNWVGRIPITVSAGIMVVVAFGLVDRWSHDIWSEFRVGWTEFRAGDARHRDATWSLAIVIAVFLVTVFVGFAASITVGTVLSMALFIREMNVSFVRSESDGQTRRSRRIYVPSQEQVLRESGQAIRVIELEGPIFFGTVETLHQAIERVPAPVRYVIVDLLRVTSIDASGAVALQRAIGHLSTRSATFLLSGIRTGDRHDRALRAAGTLRASDDERLWFDDLDQALEHVELALLAAAGIASPKHEEPFEALGLTRKLDASQVATLRALVVRHELGEGQVLFHAGDPGDCLYVLARGSVSIISAVSTPGRSSQRFASFSAGVIFGEVAILDGGKRTATAVADQPSTVYALSRADLDALCANDPALGCEVLRNVARELSGHLRRSNAIINAAVR